jgi:hypothetical protein
VDVDLVMRDDHPQAFKRNHLGQGYVERVPGTGKLLDTEHGVNVDVLSTVPRRRQAQTHRFP